MSIPVGPKRSQEVKEPLKILIVEDESLISFGYKVQLQRNGHHVIDSVRNALDAEISIAHEKPDLILMDIYLKGEKNGLQLAKEIHAKEEIPIIFITASTRPTILDEIKELNRCHLLPKPVNTDKIDEIITEIRRAS